MKFDYCIGNPPYHYEAGRRKIPLYNQFIMELTKNDACVDHVCLITPDGFIKGGQQLEPLRNHLIETKHLQKVIFHQDDVFYGASVKAAITLFNNTLSFSQVEKTVVYEDGHSETSELDWYYRDVVIDETKYKVLKIFEDNIACEDNMSIVIPGRGPFGLNFMSKCFVCNKSKFSTHKTDFYDTPVLIGAEQLKYYINTQDNLDYTSDGILSEVKLNL